jgi:hypothetical protein
MIELPGVRFSPDHFENLVISNLNISCNLGQTSRMFGIFQFCTEMARFQLILIIVIKKLAQSVCRT